MPLHSGPGVPRDAGLACPAVSLSSLVKVLMVRTTSSENIANCIKFLVKRATE
jgi:hypothetical protein